MSLSTFRKRFGITNFEALQKPIKGYHNCLWYGGDMLSFEYRGHKVYIFANGEVRAMLYDENGKYLASVKDKSNNGAFYDEFRSYIRGDRELKALLLDAYEYENAETIQKHSARGQKTLFLENNNWFEVAISKDGTWLEGLGLEASVLDEDDARQLTKAECIGCICEAIDSYIDYCASERLNEHG